MINGKITIGLLDDCATNLEGNDVYEKDEVIEGIKNLRSNCSRNSSSKNYDKSSKMIKYTFISDENVIRIVIAEKYMNINDEYIEALDKWCLIDKNQNEKKYKKVKNVFLAAAGLTILVGACKLYNTSSSKYISDLSWETKVHGGHAMVEGHKVNPHLGHDCSFGENKKEKSVEQRIEEYCKKYDLGDEVAKSAIEKFNAYYVDDVKKAEDIDLYDIYEEKGKSK